MIKVPSILLNWSVATFVLGFGIYLGCSWMPDSTSTPPRDGSLGILIFYIVTTIGGLLLYFVPSACKYLEALPLKRLDWAVNREGNPEKPRFEDLWAFSDPPTAKKPANPSSSGNDQQSSESRGVMAYPSSSSPTPYVQSVAAYPSSSSPTQYIQQPSAYPSSSSPMPYDKPVDSSPSTGNTISTSRDTSAPVDNAVVQASTVPSSSPPANTASEPLSTASSLIAALKASIEAQEQSTAAFKAVLNAHRGGMTAEQTDVQGGNIGSAVRSEQGRQPDKGT